MIEILPSVNDNVLVLKVSGNLTKADYDHMVPVMEEKIRKHGKIKMYAEIENLGIPSLSALWEDIKQDVKHYNDFSHLAVVCEPDWLASLTKLAAPLVPAEVRVFTREEKEAALAWLNA